MRTNNGGTSRTSEHASGPRKKPDAVREATDHPLRRQARGASIRFNPLEIHSKRGRRLSGKKNYEVRRRTAFIISASLVRKAQTVSLAASSTSGFLPP